MAASLGVFMQALLLGHLHRAPGLSCSLSMLLQGSDQREIKGKTMEIHRNRGIPIGISMAITLPLTKPVGWPCSSS